MVYIDQMNQKYRNMIMCHMMADTTEELLNMAKRIGVNTKWIQYPGTSHEHFDICLSKKSIALSLGAKEVGWHDIHDLMKSKEQ